LVVFRSTPFIEMCPECGAIVMPLILQPRLHLRLIIPVMTTAELRRRIKKAIDRLPPKRLESLADYVAYLDRQPIGDRIAAARKAISSGKGVNWRRVRSDV
jgi:hypothetical protein